jgi:nicotinamide-nucleotide amidase
MDLNDAVTANAAQLGQLLQARQLQIAVAESCTGGLIAQTLTAIAGSSAWFERGFVTYSNAAKIEMLGVQPKTLAEFGAVSAETALEMVAGVLKHSAADCAIAVTGIAGPGGGSAIKPVGTVFIAWAMQGRENYCAEAHFEGDRQAVRLKTAERALRYWVDALTGFSA